MFNTSLKRLPRRPFPLYIKKEFPQSRPSCACREGEARERESRDSEQGGGVWRMLSMESLFVRPNSAVAAKALLLDRPRLRQGRFLDLAAPSRPSAAVARSATLSANSSPRSKPVYTVGHFMTKKENLLVVNPTTSVDEALEMLVEKKITGFPVVDDDWNLVGVVSDYDLLALDSISGRGRTDTNMFPDVDSSWKTFNEIQKLLSKTNGRVIDEVMTPAPLVVRESTNLEDAARLLLETKYRRFPVVDGDGKLVGIITRGHVVRAALRMNQGNKKRSQV